MATAVAGAANLIVSRGLSIFDRRVPDARPESGRGGAMSRAKEWVQAASCSGDFRRCLVDGSAEDEIRQRKSKRRAIEISVALESAALAALLVLPLVLKPAGLVARTSVPIPPYRTARPSQGSRNRVPLEHRSAVCVV